MYEMDYKNVTFRGTRPSDRNVVSNVQGTPGISMASTLFTTMAGMLRTYHRVTQYTFV